MTRFTSALATAFLCLALLAPIPSVLAQPAPAPVLTNEAPQPPATDATIPPAPVVVPVEHTIDVTPVATSILDTIKNTLVVVLGGVLAYMSTFVNKWLGGKIDLQAVVANLHWEDYAKRAVDKAFNYALKKMGITWDNLANIEVRNVFLQYASQFLLSQYPEVVKWLDANNNGVIDWIETHLPNYSPVLIGASTGPGVSGSTAKVASLFAPGTSPQARGAATRKAKLSAVPKKDAPATPASGGTTAPAA